MKGKYEFRNPCSLISGNGSYFEPTLRNYYGSADLFRSALCPSAIVDTDGTLYFVTPCYINADGLSLHLGKYFIDKNTKELSGIHNSFNPYRVVFGSNLSLPKEPNTSKYNNHRALFNQTFHHALSPVLLQEFNADSPHLALVMVIHPGRWMNAQDSEGIMYHDFFKSNLQPLKSEGSNYSLYAHKDGEDSHYRTDYLRARRYSESGYTFAPNMGNLYGWKYVSKVGFQFITWKSYAAFYDETQRDKLHICYQKNSTWANGPTWTYVDTDHGQCVNRVYPRFIKVGDYVYNIFSHNYYGVFLSRTKYYTAFDYALDVNKGEDGFVGDFRYECCGYFRWIEGVNGDVSPYDHDFCIIKANDGTLICGMLGFMGKGTNTKLPNITQWGTNSNKYVVGDANCCMLVFSSFKMTIPPKNAMSANSRVLPQNIIYSTKIKRGTGAAATVKNFSATDDKRLYLNTHKICTYKSQKTGYEYLFYCYCYPGKTKQLFLGYAPYYIDKSDNYNVVLLTKTEFRDQNGDSFGNFTSCSRIISMDCKNGHLWITWMNAENTGYYVFHIFAEDLIEVFVVNPNILAFNVLLFFRV